VFLNRVSQVRILLGALSTSTNYSPHLQIRALSDLGHLTADARFWRLFSAAYCTLVARAVIMKSMRTSGHLLSRLDRQRIGRHGPNRLSPTPGSGPTSESRTAAAGQHPPWQVGTPMPGTAT